MQRSIKDMLQGCKQHRFTHWWEFKDLHKAISFKSHCNPVVYNSNKDDSHILMLSNDGVLGIWVKESLWEK